MQQIANWLQNLGLGQYAQRFAENEINFAILADLTEQDLQEIGVTSLGHRRQLLRAITELKGGETGTPKPATEYIAPVTPHDTAERRQVTVMFADLVGSTALSAHMDPEDLREVIAAYRKCTAETVRHLGGFVSQYLGDGVVVFFGYPQAHEDDAERAVRAGLQLVAAVAGLRTRASLQTRVGIATGLVAVEFLPTAHPHSSSQSLAKRSISPQGFKPPRDRGRSSSRKPREGYVGQCSSMRRKVTSSLRAFPPQ